MKKKAGNIKPIVVNTSRRKKSSKTPGIVKDTSAFKLKKSRQQQDQFDNNNLKALINNTTDLIWSVDKKLRLITSNDAFDETVRLLSGNSIKPGDAVLGKGFNEEVLSYWKRTYAKVFAGESFTEIISPNSLSGRWLEYSYYPIRKRNKIIGAACYSRDITEKKKTEILIRDERLLLRTLIDNLPMNVYAKDIHSRKTLANRADCEFMGAANEMEVLGKDDFEFFPAEFAEKTYSEEQEIFATGRGIIGEEEQHIMRDGSKRWYLKSKIPLKNEDNEMAGLVYKESTAIRLNN